MEELERRSDLLLKYDAVPDEERTTQQGLYYKIRSKMGGVIDMKRPSFITAIKDVCEKLGKNREELGVFDRDLFGGEHHIRSQAIFGEQD